MSRTFTVTEHDILTRDVPPPSARYHRLPAAAFDALEQLVLAGRQNGTDAGEFLSLSGRRGVGKVISVKNYVGVITLGEGTTIEILPKLFSGEAATSEAQAREIFFEMLHTLLEIPSRSFQLSGLRTARSNILEFFIRMFLDEALRLTKEGLRTSYTVRPRNEYFYRGKLSVTQQIKYNLVHGERFFVEQDELSADRPENRLILSTLLLLAPYTADAGNRRDICALLPLFSGVRTSADHTADFAHISFDRAMQRYERILPWCRIFLSGKSFTAFTGMAQAYSLLFPMERLFESYAAAKLSHALDPARFRMTVQDRTHSLFDDPRRFTLRPDMVVTGRCGIAILDTKWKLLRPGQSNFGISQADMYQMYAYAKKYGAREVFLLYPWSRDMAFCKAPIYQSRDDVRVSVHLLNLLRFSDSLSGLIAKLERAISPLNVITD